MTTTPNTPNPDDDPELTADEIVQIARGERSKDPEIDKILKNLR